MEAFLSEFLAQHRLPQSFADTAKEFYIPLSERIYSDIAAKNNQTYVLGVNGAQGAGKSTLADFIGSYLHFSHDLNVASLSIDDIYLTRAERQTLSEQVHPLFITRGVPGTHDVALGMQLIQSLKQLGAGESLSIPRFDKSEDDRKAPEDWDEITGPVDLIIFEGWCVGSLPVSDMSLLEPINALEKNEDADGAWRRYANDQLLAQYADLFDMLDALVLLKAPSFETVYDWRLEQEQRLAATLEGTGTQLMNEAQIARFIAHYERITRSNLEKLPELAYAVVDLDESRQIDTLRYKAR